MFKIPSIFQRFIEKSPMCVMAQMIAERMFDAEVMNRLFDEHAKKQYTRQLTFAHLVELMCDVVFNVSTSVNRAYQQRADLLKVSAAALYEKLNKLEPGVSQALLRHSYQQTRELGDLLGPAVPVLAGYQTRIVDGNYFSSTEHRLKELRSESAAPLPGSAAVVLDADRMCICDVFLQEDGYAHEASQIPLLLQTVNQKELWIGDRLYAQRGFLFGLSERQAYSLVRRTKSLSLIEKGELLKIDEDEEASYWEQSVILTHRSSTKKDPERLGLLMRRIVIELKTRKTRSGDDRIELLTTIPATDATAVKLATLYRRRWKIEGAFHTITTALCCEIKTLCYPRAALFTFTLALVAYNMVSLLNASIASAHGAEERDEVSAYIVAHEIRQSWHGMMIAVEPSDWRLFTEMSASAFAAQLRAIASKIDIARYRKHRRGPKKPRTKRTPYKNGAHLSTAAMLAKRKAP